MHPPSAPTHPPKMTDVPEMTPEAAADVEFALASMLGEDPCPDPPAAADNKPAPDAVAAARASLEAALQKRPAQSGRPANLGAPGARSYQDVAAAVGTGPVANGRRPKWGLFAEAPPPSCTGEVQAALDELASQADTLQDEVSDLRDELADLRASLEGRTDLILAEMESLRAMLASIV